MLRRLLAVAVFAHFTLWAGVAKPADDYPTKPITLIDSYQAGGTSDFIARMLAAKVSERFDKRIVVVNHPGAGGTIGTGIAAREKPDGYTLAVLASTSTAAGRALYPELRYDPLKDFAYISAMAAGPAAICIHPSFPAKSISELIALAKAKPKTIQYGSGGVGSTGHLVMELFQAQAGIQLVHVPYKGGAPLGVALVSGEIGIGANSLTGVVPYVQAGKINVLAVTGSERTSALPQAPTVAEAGLKGFELVVTYGIAAPAGTPRSAIDTIHGWIRQIVQLDDVKAKFATQGLDAVSSNSPEEYSQYMRSEILRLERVMKNAGIAENHKN
jgi:tripartite-type tricarboxylate transporter receptor subunit TctC